MSEHSETQSARKTHRGRKSSTAVTLGMTAVLAVALTGCSATSSNTNVDSEYAEVCRNTETSKRVDNEDCHNTSRSNTAIAPYFIPLYNNSYTSVPAVGSDVSGGQSKLPAGSKSTSVSNQGAKVGSTSSSAKTNPAGSSSKNGSTSRGGFGSKGGGAGS